MIRWFRSLNEKWVLVSTVPVTGTGSSRLFNKSWDFEARVYFFEKPKTKYRKIEVVGGFSEDIKERASLTWANWLNGMTDELTNGKF